MEPTHYESGDIGLHYKSLLQDEIFRRIRHSDTNWGYICAWTDA